jgi:hypothetical protein
MQRKTAYCTIVTLLFAVSLAAGAFAQTVDFQYSLGGSSRYGLIDEDGTSQYSNPLLFSLIGSRLFVSDISNMSTPVEIGTLALPGIARRIAQSGDVLYISCSYGGLAAVNVADPTKPKIVSVTTFDKPDAIGQTFGVAVKGNYVYVADYSGLFVLDMTTPSSPNTVQSFTAFENAEHHAYDAYIDGNTLFFSCEADGLYIFDGIDNTTKTLEPVAHYFDFAKALGQFYGVARDGDYLYVAAGGTGFAILNIADFDNVTLVGEPLNNNYQGVIGVVQAKDGYVYLCTEFADFYKIDVTDPANPIQAQAFLLGQHSLGISTTGNYVALANSNYGIRIFDTRSNAIQQVGEFLSMGRVVDCKGAGDFAYAAVGTKGLAILEMTNPLQPLQVAQKTLSGYANGLAVSGSTVYMAETNQEGKDGGLLEIVDVTDPLAPIILGSVALTGQPYTVRVQGNLAFVACQTAGLAIVDVSDSANPVLLGSYNTAGVCYAPVAWGENYIMVADGLKGFTALDIQDPGFPQKIADSYHLGYNLGNVLDIAVWDTWMYLPAADVLHIVNFDPLYLPMYDNESFINPIIMRHKTGQMKAVEAFDGYLLVADTAGTVRLFDIAKPDSPQESDKESFSVIDPLRVTYAADQGIAYVSSGVGGLYTFKVAVPKKPATQASGIWYGTGLDGVDNSTIGIVTDFYQAHDNVTGTLTIYGATVLDGTVTASTADNESFVKGTFVYAGGTGEINLKKSGSGLKGTITAGTLEIADVSLALTTQRGLLSYENCAPTMETGLTSAIASSSGAQKRHYRRAKRMMKKALEQTDLEGQLRLSALAIAKAGSGTATRALAASEEMLYQSALWEVQVAQAEAAIMADSICDDYQKRINRDLSLGDSAFEKGKQAGDSGRLARALYCFSVAVRHYEQVEVYYQKNVANCPTFGEAEFKGYYEGVIDFGFIAAALKVCADQSGTVVTGTARIDIEATNEHMNGKIADAADAASDPDATAASNITVNEISTVNGTILVTLGALTAHLTMTDMKYNLTTDQWEGQLIVKEQEVNGTVTLKKSADTCPEGFPGE